MNFNFTALSVDRNGAMNVVWLDNNGWQGPIAFGDPHLQPGAPVAVFFESYTALSVDRNGAMNVAWLDNNGWQGPIAFGDPHLQPGAPVAAFQQSDTVYTALSVDRNGAMNVAWLDLNSPNGWRGPIAFGDPHLQPGAPVSAFQQSDTVYTALSVDRNGFMNVAWLDLNSPKGWQGPVAFGDPHLQTGAAVAAVDQAGGYSALSVDRNGFMNVAWLDNGWKGPIAFGDPRLQPGAPVAAFYQGDPLNVYTALSVDRNGAMNVAWLDNVWKGPVAFGDPHLQPGAAVAVVYQSDYVYAALSVDRNGFMNVAWLDLNSHIGWQGPIAFGDPRLQPGAPVAAFQQSDTVYTALSVDRNGAMNVAWLDLNSPKGWQGPIAFGDPHLQPGAPVVALYEVVVENPEADN